MISEDDGVPCKAEDIVDAPACRKKEIRFRDVKREMARRVPGGMDGFEGDAPQVDAQFSTETG